MRYNAPSVCKLQPVMAAIPTHVGHSSNRQQHKIRRLMPSWKHDGCSANMNSQPDAGVVSTCRPAIVTCTSSHDHHQLAYHRRVNSAPS
jgi:hypothetical protein